MMLRQHKIGLAVIGWAAALGLVVGGVYFFRPVTSQTHEASPAEGDQLSDDARALWIQRLAGGWGGPACLVVVEARKATIRPYAKVLVWTGQTYTEGAFFLTAEGLVGPLPGPIRWTLDLAGDQLLMSDFNTGAAVRSFERWEGACPGAVELWRHREREQQRIYDERNAPQ